MPMKTKYLLIPIMAVAGLTGCHNRPQEPSKAREAGNERLLAVECRVRPPFFYEQAMTTAPPYFLIDVVDRNTGGEWTVCLQADHFLHALAMDLCDTQHIPYQQAIKTLGDLIDREKKSTFVLTTTMAIESTKPRYGEETLARLRKAIPDYSEAELCKMFLDQSRRAHFMRDLDGAVPGCTQEAIAHVLTERGMFCRKSCLDGGLHVLPKGVVTSWIRDERAGHSCPDSPPTSNQLQKNERKPRC